MPNANNAQCQECQECQMPNAKYQIPNTKCRMPNAKLVRYRPGYRYVFSDLILSPVHGALPPRQRGFRPGLLGLGFDSASFLLVSSS
jgi:hypothetical protein